MSSKIEEDFEKLHEALKNKNIDELNDNILQTIDVAATDNEESNCLMYACRFSSSVALLKSVVDRILGVGGASLLKKQLMAGDENRTTSLMDLCYNNDTNVEMIRFIFSKSVEIGGPDLLKTLLAAKNLHDVNCLMQLCYNTASSAEMIKLVAAALAHFDLFKQHYEVFDDDDAKELDEKVGIDSSTWAPNAESMAEVKELLGVDAGETMGAAAVTGEEEQVVATENAKKAEETATIAAKVE